MTIVERLHGFSQTSAGPDFGSPILNRRQNSSKGGLKFELVGKRSRCQHVTYSHNLVRSVSQSTNIEVFTYQWKDRASNSQCQHESAKD